MALWACHCTFGISDMHIEPKQPEINTICSMGFCNDVSCINGVQLHGSVALWISLWISQVCVF